MSAERYRRRRDESAS